MLVILPVQSTDVFINDADVHRIVSKKLLAPQVTDWMSPKGLSEHFINQSTSSRAAFTHSQNNSPKYASNTAKLTWLSCDPSSHHMLNCNGASPHCSASNRWPRACCPAWCWKLSHPLLFSVSHLHSGFYLLWLYCWSCPTDSHGYKSNFEMTTFKLA